ncbi:MAG: hypothetical protein GY946_16600 [bacterium]|nr:hypothetical protein [bacterium]
MKTQGFAKRFRGGSHCFGVVALAVAILVIPGANAQADEKKVHKYIGARKCKSCHGKEGIGNQYGSWLETAHAKAMETLTTDKAKEWASEASVSDPQNDEKCVKCHTTGYGVPEDQLSSKYTRDEGVQCEACHGPGRDYRKKKIMIDKELAKEKGLIPQSAEVCVGCHNDESPAWDPERYTQADGSKSGFDYELAVKAIAHPIPEGFDPLADGEAD